MLAAIQSHLGTAALAIGAIAGFLALVDWSISNTMRNRIKDASTKIWYWLSYQRTWPYVRALQQPRFFDLFFGLGAFISSTPIVVLSLYFWVTGGKASSFYLSMLPLLLAPTVIAVGLYAVLRNSLRSLFGVVTKADAAWKMLLRGFAANLLVLLVYFGGAALATPLARWSSSSPLFFAIISVGLVPLFFLYAFLLLILYILVIYVLIAIFRCFEFVALKLAEYDKGPVLAAAAALTAIGSVLKAFGGA